MKGCKQWKSILNIFGTDVLIRSEGSFGKGHGLGTGKPELKAQNQVAAAEIEKS